MSMDVLHQTYQFDKYCSLPAPEEQVEDKGEVVMAVEDEEDRPGQSDIWSAIQAQKVAVDPPAPYVHPLLRRSSSSMSQMSLEICTESLGSESGSGDVSGFLDELNIDYSPESEAEGEEEVRSPEKRVADRGVRFEEEAEESGVLQSEGKKIASVNYHSYVSKRSPPKRFPPPLPSLSRRDAPCIHVRPRRSDGRLVLDAVPASSKNYLQAQREGGRLLLSFVDAGFGNSSSQQFEPSPDTVEIEPREQHLQPTEEQSSEAEEIEAEEIAQLDEEEDEEEEEEVEVVDRGTVVEVKVSTQPQQPSGGAGKVLRSSLVINKFVGGAPLTTCIPNCDEEANAVATTSPASRRSPPTTATAAAAVVVASTLSATAEAYDDGGRQLPPENKMLFTSKRRNRGELLHSMRGCSQLRRPLFVWEPCCVATS